MISFLLFHLWYFMVILNLFEPYKTNLVKTFFFFRFFSRGRGLKIYIQFDPKMIIYYMYLVCRILGTHFLPRDLLQYITLKSSPLISN